MISTFSGRLKNVLQRHETSIGLLGLHCEHPSAQEIATTKTYFYTYPESFRLVGWILLGGCEYKDFDDTRLSKGSALADLILVEASGEKVLIFFTKTSETALPNRSDE